MEDGAPTGSGGVAYQLVEGVSLEGGPGHPTVRLPDGDRVGLSSEVAVLIVDMCQRPQTVEALAQRVVSLYEVEPTRARQDIRAFLESLTEARALRRVPAPDDVPHQPAGHFGIS